jgi:hypothetical protein
VDVAVGERNWADAWCRPGEVAVGGGGVIDGTGGVLLGARAILTGATGPPVGWQAGMVNTTDQTQRVVVEVVCAY